MWVLFGISIIFDNFFLIISWTIQKEPCARKTGMGSSDNDYVFPSLLHQVFASLLENIEPHEVVGL